MAAIALQVQTLCELTQLYSLSYEVIPWEQDLFYSTVEAHLKAHPSTSCIHNWLSTDCPLVVSSVKEVICCTLQGVHYLATYYAPAPPSTVAVTQSLSMSPLLCPPEGAFGTPSEDASGIPHHRITQFLYTWLCPWSSHLWCREAWVYSSLWFEIACTK
jgi:hypothetical protein